MDMFYSPSNNGFSHVNNTPDARPVTAEEYRALLIGQSAGRKIVSDSDGNPKLSESLLDEYSSWQNNQLVIDLNALRAAKLAALKSACAAAILAGKQCNALGSDHLYPTSKDDQAFLTARYSKAVALGSAGAPYKFMCVDQNGVWARRDHTAEQIIAVVLTVEGHITALLNQLDLLTADLSAADSVEAISAINWL